MKLIGSILGLALGSTLTCVTPSPKPSAPVVRPVPTACVVDEATHDLCVDAVVTQLQVSADLTEQVTRCTFDVVVCVVNEIVADARSAPRTVGRAQSWLSTHRSAP